MHATATRRLLHDAPLASTASPAPAGPALGAPSSDAAATIITLTPSGRTAEKGGCVRKTQQDLNLTCFFFRILLYREGRLVAGILSIITVIIINLKKDDTSSSSSVSHQFSHFDRDVRRSAPDL